MPYPTDATMNPNARQAISVSELNRQVKRLLEASYAQVWVEGELSSFSRPGSGHWYFTLKDEKSQIRCAMFRGFNQRLRFQPKEGEQIVVRGKLSLYEGRGDYQLIAEGMEPAGLGQLQAAFEALKLKLLQEGLFAPEHKKPLPRIAKRIAVVTSETGAVIHDIINVANKRFPLSEILLIPVAVQGTSAAEEISRAIKLVNQHHLAEVMIVGRGGGSLEDLWAFNEESVARAIYESDIPIVSAVGHEVDVSIADMVADYRAPTPSAAAEALTPDQYELMQSLDQQHRRFCYVLKSKLDRWNERIETLHQRLKSPEQNLEEKRARLAELQARSANLLGSTMRFQKQRLQGARQSLASYRPEKALALSMDQVQRNYKRLKELQAISLHQHEERIIRNAQLLNATSPLATLGRGYAIASNDKQEVIRDPAQVKSGDALSLKVEHGEILCEVK